MTLLESILVGFEAIGDPSVLIVLAIGALSGIIVGALPGVGPAVAISVVLPVTFHCRRSQAYRCCSASIAAPGMVVPFQPF